jgi:hypothetical protein
LYKIDLDKKIREEIAVIENPLYYRFLGGLHMFSDDEGIIIGEYYGSGDTDCIGKEDEYIESDYCTYIYICK